MTSRFFWFCEYFFFIINFPVKKHFFFRFFASNMRQKFLKRDKQENSTSIPRESLELTEYFWFFCVRLSSDQISCTPQINFFFGGSTWNSCHKLNFEYFSIKFFLYTLEKVFFNIGLYWIDSLKWVKFNRIARKKSLNSANETDLKVYPPSPLKIFEHWAKHIIRARLWSLCRNIS